jgi:two-component system LytT family response regulator
MSLKMSILAIAQNRMRNLRNVNPDTSMNMTAIIVEDEIQSHKVLRNLISQSHSDVEIIASAYSVDDGYNKITALKPDVVFLDIELPDGLGFDLLKRIPEPDFSVIFITAHDHYAITAIRFGALDFLLKPFSEEELSSALLKARRKMHHKITNQQLQILWETLANIKEEKLPSRMSISTTDGIFYIEIKTILRLEAEQNYTKFIINNGSKNILASVNLGKYEEQFELYKDFKRVHRSHLVNLNYVDRFVKSDGGYLVMKNGDTIPVSRKYKDDLLLN